MTHLGQHRRRQRGAHCRHDRIGELRLCLDVQGPDRFKIDVHVPAASVDPQLNDRRAGRGDASSIEGHQFDRHRRRKRPSMTRAMTAGFPRFGKRHRPGRRDLQLAFGRTGDRHQALSVVDECQGHRSNRDLDPGAAIGAADQP
jgi:hypothetical protein